MPHTGSSRLVRGGAGTRLQWLGRKARGPRDQAGGQRRALQGRSQGHHRGQAVPDPRPGSGAQVGQEDAGEVRREGFLPRRGEPEDRPAAQQRGRGRLPDQRARQGHGQGGPLHRQQGHPRRRPQGRDADPGGLAIFHLLQRRHLPRGGLPARRDRAAGALF